jgi:hypothetical protein
MILIGDEIVSCELICRISTVNDIKNTMSNATVLFEYNSELMIYCKNNSVQYAVIASSIKEAIYANALKAKYIIADITLASKVQKVAQNYMFDSRVLAIIEDSDQIEQVALFEIDGVILSHLL